MQSIPAYIKYFFILASIILTSYVLIVGQALISPLLAALIVALLLHPLSNKFERLKMNRGFSSVFSILVVLLALSGLSYFFSFQVGQISNDLHSIGGRFQELIDRGYGWMEATFGVEQQEQTRYLKDSLNSFLKDSTAAVTTTVSATADFFTGFFLFLIALFFLLYYRRFFVGFLYKCFKRDDHQKVGTTLAKVEMVVRNYIVGLFTVIFIVAILNSVGLMLLGIQHAIFFGVLAAVLTIIPYIGILIGSLLPILFALVTKDSLWYPLGVALLFWSVQFLEGNFITPNIVGGKVSINPFAAIIALFIGGMFWGALGMILSIPVLAIIKVICDASPSLLPLAFLLDNPPEEDILEKKWVPLESILSKRRRKKAEKKKEQNQLEDLP
ncbi:AI-2E family transporter [Nafulsella turpanensis]|uniref:AI-2E family transporter n=1 Tax=Nafulsella turpanensis TaxID=1265690 RepID=UPI000347870A|nr:AI-2E family transporter [Nafulsella turpanensis]